MLDVDRRADSDVLLSDYVFVVGGTVDAPVGAMGIDLRSRIMRSVAPSYCPHSAGWKRAFSRLSRQFSITPRL